MLSEQTDTSRTVIIIICSYVYENKTKLNLLSTCKFFYELLHSIPFYQKVKVCNLDMIEKLPPRLKNLSLNIIFNKIPKQLDHIVLPNYLEKISITSNVWIIKKIPVTIKRLKLGEYYSYLPTKDFFPLGLEKLTMCIYPDTDINILPNSLVCLKIIKNINMNFINNGLPPNLQSLIFDFGTRKNFLNEFIQKIKMLPDTIKYLDLKNTFQCAETNQLRKFIPKNIVCLKFNSIQYLDILDEYPKLTKITARFALTAINIKKIPLNIISLSCRWSSDYEISLFLLLPLSIIKLKIKYYYLDKIVLPPNIKILCIKNIQTLNNKLLKIYSSIEKLIITHKDKHLLDPNIYSKCNVEFIN